MTSIAIVGAGAVGVATCSALLHAELAQELTLYDLDFQKAEGEALDFAHVKALFPGCTIKAAPLDHMEACDVAILTAGVKSKPGESRLQLLERNLIAAETIATQFEKSRLPKILIVVTNPVDVITEYFKRRWQNTGTIVFGTGTLLDSLRLRHELSLHFHVSASNVHAWVVGEHGDSSVCLLSLARIGGLSIPDYALVSGIASPDPIDLQNRVRNAAYAVIKRKGATCHAIGETTGRIVQAILHNENTIFPLSIPLEEGICASLPCVVGAKGPQHQDVFSFFSRDEQKHFRQSLAVIKEACSKIVL